MRYNSCDFFFVEWNDCCIELWVKLNWAFQCDKNSISHTNGFIIYNFSSLPFLVRYFSLRAMFFKIIPKFFEHKGKCIGCVIGLELISIRYSAKSHGSSIPLNSSERVYEKIQPPERHEKIYRGNKLKTCKICTFPTATTPSTTNQRQQQLLKAAHDTFCTIRNRPNTIPNSSKYVGIFGICYGYPHIFRVITALLLQRLWCW